MPVEDWPGADISPVLPHRPGGRGARRAVDPADRARDAQRRRPVQRAVEGAARPVACPALPPPTSAGCCRPRAAHRRWLRADRGWRGPPPARLRPGGMGCPPRLWRPPTRGARPRGAHVVAPGARRQQRGRPPGGDPDPGHRPGPAILARGGARGRIGLLRRSGLRGRRAAAVGPGDALPDVGRRDRAARRGEGRLDRADGSPLDHPRLPPLAPAESGRPVRARRRGGILRP